MFPLRNRMRFLAFAPHFDKYDPSIARSLLYYALVFRAGTLRLACTPKDGTKLNIELTRARS